ncbi:MAG: hypothetical protein ACI4OE_07140 [Alphaproteobacteria bacterium]
MPVVWKKYPDVKPAPEAAYTDFLVAMPNPRYYSSKFANIDLNRGRPKYIFDIQTWGKDAFILHNDKIRYWAAIPNPEVCK